MSELHILRGAPGSGKTTYAKEWVTEGENRIRVNRDDIRFQLYNTYFGKPIDEDFVTVIEHASIRAQLARGGDVVDDATNLYQRSVNKLIKLAQEEGAEVTFKDFDITRDEAKTRDLRRCIEGERFVGNEVIDMFFDKNKLDKGFPAEPVVKPVPVFEKYEPVAIKPVAFIFDIDGTLANHDGVRNPYDTSRYELDKPHRDVINMLRMIQGCGYQILVVSGRDVEFYTPTLWWLHKHGIYPDQLLMRPTEKGEKTPDWIVKINLFDQYIRNNYNVKGVFDDRNRVVKAWRDIGLRVYHVQEGDF